MQRRLLPPSFMLTATVALYAFAFPAMVSANLAPSISPERYTTARFDTRGAFIAQQRTQLSTLPEIGPKIDTTAPYATARFEPAEHHARFGQFFLLIVFGLALIVIVESSIKAQARRKRLHDLSRRRTGSAA